MATTQAHGSTIIGALEGAWAAIQERHPDVPGVVVITGTGMERRWMTWGHFCAERWVHGSGGERVHELFASGELLSLGGRRVLETLLHEAAHALATARDIKDTSNSGRYHNKRFMKLAVELGLSPAARSERVKGWSDCPLGDRTAKSYAAVIERLDAAKLPYLRGASLFTASPVLGGGADESDPVAGGRDPDDEGEPGEVPHSRASRAGKRFAISCGCEPPRRIQVTPATYEVGGIICALCVRQFTPAPREPGGGVS